MGIKHSELNKSEQKYKARIVLAGNGIKDSEGRFAIFDDVGSVPAQMAAARSIMAVSAATQNYSIWQSDCVRAYIQAALPDDCPPTYIRLPKAWWPPHFHLLKDPVVRLWTALYGHPRAGDIWHDKFASVVKGRGFKTVEGWPSVYVKRVGEETCSICVYVDDLLVVGGALATSELIEIRKLIEMEEPSNVSRYLGCGHLIKHEKVSDDVLTHYGFEMVEYFKSACEIFVSETGHALRAGTSTPSPPELPLEEVLKLVGTPGVYEDNALSFLMKLLYGARLCAPWLVVAVQRLACHVTKWNAECDRRLKRIYDFLHSNPELMLTGCLAKSDSPHLSLHVWPDADLNGDMMHTKSTGGCYIEVQGLGDRCFPICYGCRKQNGSALHTPESETVSLATFLRNDAALAVSAAESSWAPC
jgi:hypothetical protein